MFFNVLRLNVSVVFVIYIQKLKKTYMGGLSKHMMHVYDNYGLTIDAISDMISDLINGNVELHEKIDGFNIHVSYINGSVRFFRNKNDILSGGMTARDMEEKWSDNPRVRDVYMSAAKIITPYIEGLSYFFNSNDHVITLNVECVDGKTNIIPYAYAAVFIHNVWLWDKQTGEVLDVCDLANYQQAFINESYKYSDIFTNLPIFQTTLEPDKKAAIDYFVKRLEDIMGSNYTLYGYYYSRFKDYMDLNGFSWFFKLDETIKKAIFERLFFNIKSVEVNVIYKACADKCNIKEWLNIYGKIAKRCCMYDIKLFFIKLGNFLMRHCYGYINYPNRYIICDILDNLFKSRLSDLYDSGTVSDEQDFNVNLIRDAEWQINALEGFVFDYKGDKYKLTGTFGPLNQIMWDR